MDEFAFSYFLNLFRPEPYILGELRQNMASFGWRKNYPWYMVHFRNKTFLFVNIESWIFQQLFEIRFNETLQNFSSFRQTFRWHFSMGKKSCLNELKFCEVSRNNESKIFWIFPRQRLWFTLQIYRSYILRYSIVSHLSS
jgi:hypothetical protein